MHQEARPLTGAIASLAIYSLRLTPIGKTTQRQPFTAAAHLRYIARERAASHVMAERMPEAKSRAMRWLRAEEGTDRANARVADKLVIALPKELTLQQQITLVWGFAEALTKGRASWYAALHAKGKDRHNPHCHVLVRDRDIETRQRVVMFSAGPKEVRARAAKGQSLPTTLHDIRSLWEQHANAALAAAGRSERIDRRTLAAQGVARSAQVHEGPNARAMQARGFRPASRERVVRNRGIRRPGMPATRIVRYAEIDRGRTRLEYNAALRQAARAGFMAPERDIRQITNESSVTLHRASRMTAWQTPTASPLPTFDRIAKASPPRSPPAERPIATTSPPEPPRVAPPSIEESRPMSLTERLMHRHSVDRARAAAAPERHRGRGR